MFNYHPFYFAPAQLAWGSDVNERYGLSLSPERLVLQMADIPGLTAQAEFTHWPASTVAEQWVIVDGKTAAVVAFDINSPGSAMFLAQNLVHGLPLVLFDEANTQARLVVARCTPPFEESARRATKYFVDVEPVAGREEEFLADVRRTFETFVETARSGKGRGVMHYRPVFSEVHYERLHAAMPERHEPASDAPNAVEEAAAQLSLFESAASPQATDQRQR